MDIWFDFRQTPGAAARGGGSLRTPGTNTAAERRRALGGGQGEGPSPLRSLSERGSGSGWHIDLQTAGAFPSHTSGFTSAADLCRTLNTCERFFFFYLCGTQVCLILWERWDGPDGPGPHGACGAARRCCLNMLNDIKIEDRLRTDASSLEVLLGECSPPPEPFSSSEHSWTVFSFVEEKKKCELD